MVGLYIAIAMASVATPDDFARGCVWGHAGGRAPVRGREEEMDDRKGERKATRQEREREEEREGKKKRERERGRE